MPVSRQAKPRMRMPSPATGRRGTKVSAKKPVQDAVDNGAGHEPVPQQLDRLHGCLYCGVFQRHSNSYCRCGDDRPTTPERLKEHCKGMIALMKNCIRTNPNDPSMWDAYKETIAKIEASGII